MLRVCALAATTFFLTLSSVTSALGHPHMWLDLESRFCLICGFLSESGADNGRRHLRAEPWFWGCSK